MDSRSILEAHFWRGSATPTIDEKYAALLGRIAELESLLVAYSGGVDSSLLAFCGHAVLGERCKAVFAISDTCPEDEIATARDVAQFVGLTLLEVDTYELADPRFAANTPDRCYYCKSELFALLARVAEVHGLDHVADGANADDMRDHRPGRRAAAEYGVVSPLQEVGMTKDEIRHLARELGLPNWDRPSMACLASRFPYGERITDEGLGRVASSERALREMGFRRFRVRSHGDIARVEVAPEELERAFANRERLTEALREAGFPYVTLDLQGYRTGSMNETLPAEKHSAHSTPVDSRTEKPGPAEYLAAEEPPVSESTLPAQL